MLRAEGRRSSSDARPSRAGRPSQTNQAELVERILSGWAGPRRRARQDLAASRFGVRCPSRRCAAPCSASTPIRTATAGCCAHPGAMGRASGAGPSEGRAPAAVPARGVERTRPVEGSGRAGRRGPAGSPRVVEHLLLDAPRSASSSRLVRYCAAGDPRPAQAPYPGPGGRRPAARRAPAPQIECCAACRVRSVRGPRADGRGPHTGGSGARRDLGLDLKRIRQFDRLVRAEARPDRRGLARFLAACVSTWPVRGSRTRDGGRLVWPRYAARLDPSRKGLLGTGKPEEDAGTEQPGASRIDLAQEASAWRGGGRVGAQARVVPAPRVKTRRRGIAPGTSSTTSCVPASSRRSSMRSAPVWKRRPSRKTAKPSIVAPLSRCGTIESAPVGGRIVQGPGPSSMRT
jgi:hypothetical protein